MRTTCLALLLAALPLAHADDDAPPCDRSAIRWTLPGKFADARARATAEKRLLILKGIAFGVDELGATCATKGNW